MHIKMIHQIKKKGRGYGKILHIKTEKKNIRIMHRLWNIFKYYEDDVPLTLSRCSHAENHTQIFSGNLGAYEINVKRTLEHLFSILSPVLI